MRKSYILYFKEVMILFLIFFEFTLDLYEKKNIKALLCEIKNRTTNLP
jgi:hypothetical protein